MSWHKKKAQTEAEADQQKNHKNRSNELIQSYKLIEASDEVKSKASDTHESAVRSQWESTKADMQDDESCHQAEHDQIDVADAWDTAVI